MYREVRATIPSYDFQYFIHDTIYVVLGPLPVDECARNPRLKKG
jgi:hypothetical protein